MLLLLKGEDEAMFLEYRKDIKLVFDSITQLVDFFLIFTGNFHVFINKYRLFKFPKNNEFVLAAVKSLVLEEAVNWQYKEFNEVENALFLLHSIGEAIPVGFFFFK